MSKYDRPLLEPALLAAFVAGTLAEEVRAEVLEILARSAADRRLLADVAVLLHNQADSGPEHQPD